MRGEYQCNICGFAVPADEIGVEIMKEHLREEHPPWDDPNSDPLKDIRRAADRAYYRDSLSGYPVAPGDRGR